MNASRLFQEQILVLLIILYLNIKHSAKRCFASRLHQEPKLLFSAELRSLVIMIYLAFLKHLSGWFAEDGR